MYESPITLISGAFHLNLEDGVYKAVRQTGVVVDKDELIKRTDLEEETIDDVIRILEAEFADD